VSAEVFLTFFDLRPRGITFCRLHINRLVDRDLFPQPVWLSSNRKVWLASDVDRWLATRPTARPARGKEGAFHAAT
jgi:Prophage CP4-57 regulatory protein (AlpA)